MTEPDAPFEVTGQARERDTAATTLSALRAFLLALLLVGCAGTLAELVLSQHTDDLWQRVPIVLLGVGLPLGGIAALRRHRAFLWALRALMVLFVASGFAGAYFHFSAKAEFALERQPDLGGFALFRECLKGSSPPLLAPGAMIGLGLIGLAWTFRQPALRPTTPGSIQTPGARP
jgi:hypothetical protein